MAMEAEEALKMSEEEVEEKLTEVAFEMIANVGTARGMYIEAIQEAKKGNFEHARELIAEGKIIFVEGHHAHADVLTMQGAGVKLPNSILLIHAEDQLMAAESFETIATELIEVHELLKKKEN
jgi:PTS system cellobiose-specific IIA component